MSFKTSVILNFFPVGESKDKAKIRCAGSAGVGKKTRQQGAKKEWKRSSKRNASPHLWGRRGEGCARTLLGCTYRHPS